MARLARLTSLSHVLVEVYAAISVRVNAAGNMDPLSALKHDLYGANPVGGAGEKAQGVKRGECCGREKDHRLVTGNSRFSAATLLGWVRLRWEPDS